MTRGDRNSGHGPDLRRHPGPPHRPSDAHNPAGSLLARWDDPLTWSVALFEWFGTRVALHWLLIFWAAIELTLTLPFSNIGGMYVGMGVGSVVAVVFLRELVRLALASRYAEPAGYAPLWPLGSMIPPATPPGARGAIVVLTSGLAVNLVIGGALAISLRTLGADPAVLLPNPLKIRDVMFTMETTAQTLVWWAYFANLAVTVLNLIPAYPLDGARILEWLLSRRNKLTARRRAAIAGLFFAGALLVVAAVADQSRVLCVGLIALLASRLELRRAEFSAAPAARPATPVWLEPSDPDSLIQTAPEDPDADEDDDDIPPPPPAAPPATDETEVDRILAKISIMGVDALSPQERAILEEATRRRRKG